VWSLLTLAAAGLAIRSYIGKLSAIGHRGSRSRHFDGKRFQNAVPTPDKSVLDLLRWGATSSHPRWEWREVIDQPPPPRRVSSGEIRITFVNHSTVLVQTDGLNILTDPIWSRRTSPFSWVGPARFHRPGIPFETLPPIDVVLVSHNHYDHLDLPTLRRLARDHSPRIFTGLGNRQFLQDRQVSGSTEMDWHQRIQLTEDTSLICVPAQHWSTRTRTDLRTTLWCGFILLSPKGNVYFAGDTGFGPHFEEISKRYGPFRLALLPIGSYLPRWFMRSNHISPDEAVSAHRMLRASISVAIHFGTFKLGDERQDQAVQDLRLATFDDPALQQSIWVLAPGEGRAVP